MRSRRADDDGQSRWRGPRRRTHRWSSRQASGPALELSSRGGSLRTRPTRSVPGARSRTASVNRRTPMGESFERRSADAVNSCAGARTASDPEVFVDQHTAEPLDSGVDGTRLRRVLPIDRERRRELLVHVLQHAAEVRSTGDNHGPDSSGRGREPVTRRSDDVPELVVLPAHVSWMKARCSWGNSSRHPSIWHRRNVAASGKYVVAHSAAIAASSLVTIRWARMRVTVRC